VAVSVDHQDIVKIFHGLPPNPITFSGAS